MMMLFKGIFASLAGPSPNYDMQKVLSTRSPKEASKMTGFVSIVLLPIRYSMVIGLTVLALLYYNKLNVSSPAGTDFERVFPAAINTFLPVGLLGLVLTGLLGAFMGTFSGTVNAAQAYIVNDIYLKYINPDAPTKRIIAMNYMTGVVVVALGVILGFFAKDVNSILQWIVGALYGGYIAANMLKWYWWRFTGKATIVPKWAMGFWQSRERYKTQNEILNTVDEFRKRKIPLDNIVLDWSYWKENDWGSQEFDATRFPNPDSMIKVLHNKYNTHFMISVWPKFYEGITAYNDFNKRGWLYKRNIAERQRDWIAKGYVSTFYDAFNNDAKKGFWDLLNRKLYSKGIDAWWMDASEPDILSNVSPQKRKAQMTPTAAGVAAEYLNAYPLENAKGIYYGQRSADPNKRAFLLTRSGFAGSQHYAAAIWSGDIASRWTDMKDQISAGINFSMSGLPYWTMDIGGFAVERRFENAKNEDLEEWRELQTRWYQFGAFVPLFRVHGQFPFREVFNIAPQEHPAYQSMLYYNKLRYRLMPYIYTLAGKTYHDDYTIMRGLVMDFSKDTAVRNIGDQYMFGPSLLINPVYDYKARKKNLYLPLGNGWYDLYSGKYFQGGQRITTDAPYERMPVFVKEGSIIPVGHDLQYTSQKPADTITLHIYTGKDAVFTLYEDEDTNYNYEKGAFSNIPFIYNEAKKQLIIGERKGSFQGMLQNRIFKVVWISKSNPKGMNFENMEGSSAQYNGKSITIKMSPN